MLDPGILGVDIGSVCISTALIETSGEIRSSGYRFHRGKVRECLRSMVDDMGRAQISGVAATSGSPRILRGARWYDPQVSLIAACRRRVPNLRTIIFIGGERFGLVRFDRDGEYRGTRSNSSCAAGTGSFLDQQARRLGFPGIEELVRRARASTTPAPKISTRCAVFARTDLVHAQQAGYSLEEICDGLCGGLAQNIADTLLGGESPAQPVVLAGGVAANQSVRAHLERILGVLLRADPDAPILGAAGAALCLVEEGGIADPFILDPGVLVDSGEAERKYFFEPLEMEGVGAEPEPEERRSLFCTGRHSSAHPVEVDDYASTRGGRLDAWMGIDIGSTSTKAILIDSRSEAVAGFYTRTQGSPLTAVQALCEAIEDWQERTRTTLHFLGVGTTGAGRKFIGSLVKADLVVDEITAHARAAYSLDPGIDTIIEIGGQDAKFTTMRDGMVTFSHMNTVCAAGTGSFLEEQAARLGCELSDYERRVRGARAPLSSDRCTVFMERDINNFVSQGFSTEEILTAALYSVRENYLTKVARGAAIGTRIAFQGATARNRALVAAFREGLGKPVLVSRYCHLTGALGAALLLAEKETSRCGFVGLAALREEIPVRVETCALCGNHCRLRLAEVAGETVAYGFLCGRDYGAARYVDRDRSGFNLLKERRKAFARMGARSPGPSTGASAGKSRPVIGIPAALGLYGQLPLWKMFFSELGIPFVTSESFADGITLGREVQGAEFCAPLAALHGHVNYLGGKADWIFLPVFLEESRHGTHDPRVYCYYTQFSSALASRAGDPGLRERCLMPTVSWTRGRDRTKRELYICLREAGLTERGPDAVSDAFEHASAAFDEAVRILQRRFRDETARSGEPSVVLLGRPYNVLAPEMSKGIPEIFGSLGVKVFSQDMVPCSPRDVERIAPLLDMVHWLHAARVLEAACIAADTPGLYPVFLTSFKCSPDSFAIEYFKRILDAKEKPYLILQLDDHDSTLGYETRIEAGVASFRNHAARDQRASREQSASSRPLPVVPRAAARLGGRTLLYPNWDPLVNPLLAANLRREGVDARVLEENAVGIRKAMRHNTGQCLPMNIIAQDAIDYVKTHGLDPAKTAVWMPRSTLSCNIGMFAPFLKSLMEAEGDGMERMEVYAGDVFYREVSRRAAVNCYKAYLAGGLLRRVGCRLRPYETSSAATDRAIARAMEILVPAFEGKSRKDEALRSAAEEFDAVTITEEARRPRVAIFGDLYVRDNDVMNQGLIRAIEGAGGEAITTPYTEYVRIIAESYFRKWSLAGAHFRSLSYRALWLLADTMGSSSRLHFARFLDPEPEVTDTGSELFLREFGLRPEHAGESFDNLMKIFHLVRAHPELALFVQASPAFCCPSMVTEAMTRDIERLTGVPVVSLTYDGTGQYQNEAIVPYITFAARKPAGQEARTTLVRCAYAGTRRGREAGHRELRIRGT
ncbi:MAG: acyl-CoA dehydratase activase [Spirochaetia bacterium]